MAHSANILIFGEGISLAHVTRPLLLARELSSRGHRLHFVTGPCLCQWVNHHGMDATSVYTPDADAIYGRLRRLQPMYRANELEQCIDADLAVIRSVQPDVIVGDCRNSLRISTELSGVPYAAITNANCTPWFSGSLSAPAGFALNRWLGKHRVDRYLVPLFGRAGRALVCRRLSGDFDRIHKRRGLTGSCRDFRQMFTSPQLNLIADLPQLMPSRNLPGHCHYVGPLCWLSDPQHTGATRRLLDGISPAQPLIYVTAGSTGSPTLLATLAPLLGDLPCQFVVTTGTRRAAIDWPDNLHPIEFASAEPILKRAVAVISHGGSGSIYQALASGLPAITVPGFFDQETQADQLEHCGLGLRLAEDNLASTLRPAVDRLLREPGFRDRAARFAQLIDATDAPRAAADLVEALAAASSVQPAAA